MIPAVAGAGGERQQLSIVRVARAFAAPVYVAATPSEPARLYIVEQEGRIFALDKGKRRLFLDIRGRVGADSSEQGLLSMAFHPNYAKNRRFYVNYTDLSGHTRVVEFRSDRRRARLGTARRILFVPQPYANHNGGQLQFGPDGKLYVGMGDGGSGGDPHNNGQSPRALLAKLLRTNPLAVDWEIAGYGLRNPWRFSFDRTTGDLYIADVGQNAREEIDYRPRGAPAANFGWARYEGSRTFEGDVELDPPSPLVFPIHEYGHGDGCSVTGGYVYRGSDVPAAVGRYFFGDYCSGTVWSLKVVDGKATGVRREPFDVSSLTVVWRGRARRALPRLARRRHLPPRALDGLKLGERADDDRVATERVEQPVEGARPRLQPLQPASDAQVGCGHPSQRLRPRSEGADAHAFGGQPPQLGVGGRVRPQIDAGMVFRKTLQQPAPVADGGVQGRFIHPVVQLHAIAALRVRQPGPPQGLGVAEHGIEVDDDRPGARHTRTLRAARPRTYTPSSTPTASTSTSSTAPCRPGTNAWCTSSVTA